MTVGLRLYVLAVSGTAAVLLTLTWVHRVEERLVERTSTTLDIRMRAREDARRRVEAVLASLDVEASLTGLARGDRFALRYRISCESDALDRLAEALMDEPFVESLEIGAGPRRDRGSRRGPGDGA